MSIEVTCNECGQKMVNQVIQHSKGCDGYLLQNISGTDYIVPPASTVKFSSKEEADKFMKNLGTGGKNL